MNGLLTRIRADRVGSQFYDIVAKVLYCIHHNEQLFVCRSEKYGIGFREDIFFTPLFDKFILVKSPKWKKFFNESKEDWLEDSSNEMPSIDGVVEFPFGGLRHTPMHLLRKFGVDLLTHSKTQLDFNLNNFSHITPDFKTGQIVIHIRNGDMSNQPIYDGFKVHEYCKNLVENEGPEAYDRSKMDENGLDHQCPTSEAALDKVLSEVCLKYPEKEVHLVSEDKSFSTRRYKNISEKYNIKFFSSDVCTDFYHLATSDVLIGSRSALCIMALYYFTGKEFFYPHWSLYTCLGLGTKYDKTNYKSFRNI